MFGRNEKSEKFTNPDYNELLASREAKRRKSEASTAGRVALLEAAASEGRLFLPPEASQEITDEARTITITSQGGEEAVPVHRGEQPIGAADKEQKFADVA